MEKITFTRFGDEPLKLFIPPPCDPELFEKVVYIILGEEKVQLYIPPPQLVAVLLVKLRLVRIGEEEL